MTGSIKNAFLEVFGKENDIVMCWAHMRRCVCKKIEKIVEKKHQKDILADIDKLQLSQNKTIFDHATELFFEKWESEERFLTYFKSEWINQNKNWYEGLRLYTPSTNNALESCNGVIKKENTIRERLPLSKFRVILFEMTQGWSNLYKYKLKQFQVKPSIDLPLWTEAYQWVRQNKFVSLLDEDENSKYYVVSTNTEKPIVIPDTFQSFNEFKEKIFTSYKINLPQESWDMGTCNCSVFMKQFICKHVVGLAIRLKLTKPPTEAKNLPIGAKRKPGRPSKAKKALIIQ